MATNAKNKTDSRTEKPLRPRYGDRSMYSQTDAKRLDRRYTAVQKKKIPDTVTLINQLLSIDSSSIASMTASPTGSLASRKLQLLGKVQGLSLQGDLCGFFSKRCDPFLGKAGFVGPTS